VRAGVLTATGGPRTMRTLTTTGDRALVGSFLAARIPSLINAPGITHIDEVAVPLLPQYNENLPLRDGEALNVRLTDGSSQIVQSPVINTVAGAIAIQEYLDRTEWVMQSASPVAYAPYLRTAPLAGVAPKRIIIQFAKGDQSMPNPATTAMVRTGDLTDRATFYRHDLAFLENPSLPKNPHGFMPLIGAFGEIARGAQEQIDDSSRTEPVLRSARRGAAARATQLDSVTRGRCRGAAGFWCSACWWPPRLQWRPPMRHARRPWVGVSRARVLPVVRQLENLGAIAEGPRSDAP
jgi:hypothetical protein